MSARFDPVTGTETLTLEGTATLDLHDGAFELTNMQLGKAVDFSRSPDSYAPFTLAYPYHSETHKTMILPDKGRGFTLDPLAFDQAIAGVSIRRDGMVWPHSISADAGSPPEFPVKGAAAAEQELRRLSHQHVYLRRTSASGV